MNKYIKIIVVSFFSCIMSAMMLSSCTKFVDAGSPKTSITVDKVFNDSAAALGSVLYLYSNTIANMMLYTSQFGAMSADDAYYFSNVSYDPFRTNTLSGADALFPELMYQNLFFEISAANKCIEGVQGSTSYGQAFKDQLTGECLFWRAYCYFYLVNFYGDVALVTTADVAANASLPRMPADKVYEQIVKDLLDAKNKVSAAYPSAERARVNKMVVSALLARVYLYQENWEASETEATNVIGSHVYSLETDLNNVFLKTSNEVIWQTVSQNSNGITGYNSIGQKYIPAATVPSFVLYDTLVNTFEPADLRKAAWTKSITYNAKTYYYPYKYKIRATTSNGNEYNVMIRLAEIYLIRAEARAQRADFTGAQDDVNEVRTRAGLAGKSYADLPSVMTALEHERWVELFTEWSDRWFNLKRTKRADTVLKIIKPQWMPYQALYPFYANELKQNPNLIQNEGY